MTLSTNCFTSWQSRPSRTCLCAVAKPLPFCLVGTVLAIVIAVNAVIGSLSMFMLFQFWSSSAIMSISCRVANIWCMINEVFFFFDSNVSVFSLLFFSREKKKQYLFSIDIRKKYQYYYWAQPSCSHSRMLTELLLSLSLLQHDHVPTIAPSSFLDLHHCFAIR